MLPGCNSCSTTQTEPTQASAVIEEAGQCLIRPETTYTSICSNRGGRTVFGQARDNLRIEVACTFDHMHARAILAEMTRLLDAGWDQDQSLPRARPILRKQSVYTGDALGPVLPFADVTVLDIALPRC